MLQVRREGVLARPPPVPGDARRHRAQLRRGHRLPRPPGRRARRRARSWRRCRSRSTRAGSSRRPGPGPAATACRPSRCSTRSRSTASTRCSAAGAATRRRPGPRSGCSRFRDEFGQWDPKNQRPELWNLYNGRHRKGEHIRVFPISNWTELDVWQYIAARASSSRRSTTRTAARCSGATACCSRSTPFVSVLDGEEAFEATRAVPHRRRRHVHRRGRVDRRRPSAEVIVEVAATPHHRAGRDPGRRQVHRGRHGRPQEGGVLLTDGPPGAERTPRMELSGSPPPAPSTTARARSSAGCSSTPSRSSRTSSKPSSARAASGAFDYTNLALLTDGLRAEREQGITIDVAYRYFATPRRKFIIADTPGHVQYTRNMVTGASTADLALILVDARKGVRRADPPPRRASRRCCGCRTSCSASTRWTSSTTTRTSSRRSRTSSGDLASRSTSRDLTFIPISALHGDNVVTRTRRTRRGTRARRCCTTSSTCTSARTATSSTAGSRCSGSSARCRTS